MDDTTDMMEALETRAKRREERRNFFRAFGTASALAGGFALTAKTNPAHAQSTPSDADVLNFALNLEYLEAQFYAYAATGSGLSSSLLDGSGTAGSATGARQVTFTDPAVAQFAREIAADERAHVAFLRDALGSSAVAQPAIDIGTDPDGAFSTAARAAGLIGEGESFDPYANDENFLLAAFIFEDVGVTAYKGASPLVSDKTFLEAAAGILAVEAYHAAMIRSTLYAKGIDAPSLISATEAISDARDSLDGDTDLDQGIAPAGSGSSLTSNIAPLDSNGIAYSRSYDQVLNIVYLNAAAATGGGFFPQGVNGTLNMSAQNS
ncbi:ferritin-like domain-containing protein [Stakelama sp. CBK3Z-3]|uniref:Ferritin-like domain-containing protein n=1 Tax=Stakelama flava TaxID=2860338 RepID=A0ABS6XJU6_9SPHN|nr:ferritin-like domain-containing protein [Stakelama flava]MBW4330476.1 ferritin-like domain-containing protein [Stakelama flava]